MYKIFTIIRIWLGELLADEVPADPLASMSARELADLPVHHPRSEQGLVA
jgi:hypothetical protein